MHTADRQARAGRLREPWPGPGRAWLPVAGVLLGAGWGSNQFTPMLLVYQRQLGLHTVTLEALFGAYAVGLIPGLLVAGSWSDRHGRRGPVIWSAVLSLLASVSLIAGGHTVALLFAGRLLAGAGSGAAFGAGTTWLRETSLPPHGGASAQAAGRRAAVAMTAGFAAGPLVSGVLAQWAPIPTVLPYLPHIALMAAVVLSLRRAPETHQAAPRRTRKAHAPTAAAGFRRVVAPMAPWVFAAPAIAFALLPSITGAGATRDGVALTAAVTSLTALAGVLIQTIARSLDTSLRATHGGVLGLLALVLGLGLAAVAAHAHQAWLLLPCAVVLGAAYGLCLIAGLLEVQRLASHESAASLTAAYYALAYLGFAAPYLLALGSRLASYPVLLLISAALALVTAAWVHHASGSGSGVEHHVELVLSCPADVAVSGFGEHGAQLCFAGLSAEAEADGLGKRCGQAQEGRGSVVERCCRAGEVGVHAVAGGERLDEHDRAAGCQRGTGVGGRANGVAQVVEGIKETDEVVAVGGVAAGIGEVETNSVGDVGVGGALARDVDGIRVRVESGEP